MPNPTARRPARNTAPTLRPHQRDALAAVVRELENPDPTAVGSARYGGRRATAVMACGTGKTWVAAATAATLAAHDRVLVLVPTLDLLVQTVRAWQRAGRVGGTQVAVCSLGGDAALGGAGVRATTSAPQLALWAGADGALTVYATYQSLGTILDAHAGVYGLRLAPWRLVCVDEGHRTSGSLAKDWGAVHDDRRLPTQGRLYLTATPRVWEPPANSTYSEGTGEGEAERPPILADDAAWDDPDAAGPGGLDNLAEDDAGRDDEGGAGPPRVRGGRPVHSPLPLHAVASMENEEIFGPTVHRLELAAGVRLGLLARPRIVVVDVADPTVQNLATAGGIDLNRGPGRRTLEEVEEYRAARLAALQTAVLRGAADQGLNTVIAYHARTAEAQVCAETLPDVAKRLHETDPQRYPAAVWADWLCGEHETEHRRRVLGDFATHADREPAGLFEVPARSGMVTRRAVLSNVRVLAEGVDLRADAVAFMDPKLSVIEIVQAIGRVLRQEPHEGRTATIIVPVFLAAGEQPDDMLVSDSYHFLVRVLHALAAHDSRVLDMLATPAPSGSHIRLTAPTDTDAEGDAAPETQGDESEPAEQDSEGEGAGEEPEDDEERFLVRFMTERDPALLADFVKLRVIDPERRDWRRGYRAARRWHAAHGDLRVPLEAIDYDAETGTSHPVGAWISEQRRAWSTGTISARRIELLEALGMVWSPDDAAFEDGLAMCRAYHAVHGHLAAPKTAAVNNYPVGQFLANCRRPLESRKNPTRWAQRWARLAAVDPDWNPTGRSDPARRWPLDWQRILTTVRLHIESGGSLDELVPGHTIEGEDVGAWLQRQRRSGAGLSGAQREALAGVGVRVAVEERPVVLRAVDRWTLTLAAATAFREREGHLTVPRKHVETVKVDDEAHAVKLGVALANARQRQASWAAERVQALTGLGMRWG
ncbi:Helicase associated domain protein [Embleya sp. NBC_00896]|uniref:DEAD/DEAH box helicase n=1 Tax=Embleya sp. NBC_00896 TaxID=2975961 RepID=UPI002F90D167|nr:Helicase associated domain protein [Embleya sp. NBC_00896]